VLLIRAVVFLAFRPLDQYPVPIIQMSGHSPDRKDLMNVLNVAERVHHLDLEKGGDVLLAETGHPLAAGLLSTGVVFVFCPVPVQQRLGTGLRDRLIGQRIPVR